MFRYTSRIRLNGSVTNEVRKTDMSPAEVIIMRRLHGNDAVLDIVETPGEYAPGEREILEARYAKALAREKPPITFEGLFGPSHIDLPPRLPDFAKNAAAKATNVAKPPKLGNPAAPTGLADITS